MRIFFYWQQFFVSALMFLATCNVSAQQTTLSKETEVQPNLIYLKPVENEKLQQYTLNKIFLSKTGKLYLGTNSGLVCYDGLSVKTYSHIDGDTNSLNQNNIVDIVEDKKGNLYLSTKSGGINYLNLKTGKTKHLSI